MTTTHTQKEFANASSVSEIITANRNAGMYFFSSGAMQFFKSKVYDDIFFGCVFITSEKQSGNPRKYSVRVAYKDGDISRLGDSQPFDSKAEAFSWAKRNNPLKK